tara:strand:+ start:2711 stop:3181 length:471 start_codon:yes stop_codon:yes gene_type:complete
MQSFLMVCLGNICRSPLAQGILHHKLNKLNIDNINVDSAGTGNWHVGSSPDKRSIEIAMKHEIDISNQKARQFSYEDFEKFDQIFVMDTSNLQNIRSQAKSKKDIEKIKLILDYSYPDKNESVPDPYFGGIDGFEQVYNLLNNACDKIIENLIKKK